MANIIQRSPLLGDVARFSPFMDVDDWFNNFGMRPFSREMEAAPQIRMDLTENDKSYVVRAEIPGVNKEDIKVTVDGNMVSISAEVKREKEEKKGEKVLCRERYQGSSYRSFTLSGNVDESKTQAKYDNGVLELTLPKKNGNGHKEIAIS
jgi:HSP20 family protein